ncbi:TauD/TfdA family dioxygenase [Mycolicibacterium stellerae]|uniref:TauD/TfdA family dioxygenase n=1 Tax=Mycolicibacterium stellerae TaxID=2358193 RepID=UPI000F0BA4A1|nr:TauD/TfdA family dioxygenase [Mycolicibacterium stellerae]
MTTYWEEPQSIWYASGLAEVLAGPAAQEAAGDSIVQFNRSGRAHPAGSVPASPNALSHANQRRLDRWGYVVVPDVGNLAAAEELVRSVGDLIPQYNGHLVHEVTYRPGNDHKAYSQSANTILAHTEAPGWHPSPAYLALFCHRQARCGGGHTDLLDVRKLVGALDADEIGLMTDAELDFPGPNGGVRSTMLSTDAAGDTVARFSYNLLTTSDYDPALDADVEHSGLPLGEPGRRLARRVSDLFRDLRTSVLIPDGALLIWDNQRMLHARSEYADRSRHLTRFFCSDWRRA